MIVFKFSRRKNGEEVPQGFEVKPGFYSRQSKMEELIKPYMFKGMLNNKFTLNSCNVCYLKDLLTSHSCKDETIINGEDWAYSYECFYYAKSVYFLNKNLYFYNDVSTSVSNEYRDTAKRLEDFCKLMIYIGKSFAYDAAEIKKGFGECILYGISKLINKLTTQDSSSILSPELAEICVQLIQTSRQYLKIKDRLYSVKLIKQIKRLGQD